MSLQQFHSDDSLRTQRMTADEAKSVIDLWQQERVEQTGLTDKPAVPDLAEGLDVPIEEVQRLLGEVRAQRVEEERALAQEQELSEVRLAEEERRLAEIRRQRAELRREQAESERGGVAVSPSYKRSQGGSIGIFFGAIFLIFWLWWMFNIVNASNHQGYLGTQQSAPQATCPPGMYPMTGHDASFGCISTPFDKQDK